MGSFIYLLFAGICFQNAMRMAFNLFTKSELTTVSLGKNAVFSKAISSENTSGKRRALIDTLGWLLCGSLIIFCLSEFKN